MSKEKILKFFCRRVMGKQGLVYCEYESRRKSVWVFTVVLKDGYSGPLEEAVPKEDKVEKVGMVVLLATQPWRWKNIVHTAVSANL